MLIGEFFKAKADKMTTNHGSQSEQMQTTVLNNRGLEYTIMQISREETSLPMWTLIAQNFVFMLSRNDTLHLFWLHIGHIKMHLKPVKYVIFALLLSALYSDH